MNNIRILRNLFRVALVFAWVAFPYEFVNAQVSAKQDRRVALVIGNAKYDTVYSLKNSVNDSSAISEVLSRLGFEVIERNNVNLKGFKSAIQEFEEASKDADASVFYYAGHGFQMRGVNYLVPTDASLKSKKSIEKETLKLNEIIQAVQSRNRQTLILLDACRNNPLPKKLRAKNSDGLAQLETGNGTFVAFATQPGNITRDGAGEHSPFTTALLEHIETPGISVSDMMIRVRNSVEAATAQTQTPWDQSSLRDQFYFNPDREDDSELSDEDRELLAALSPELRRKFERRFGLRIEAGDDSEGDGNVELASLSTGEQPKPTLLIEQSADTGEDDQTDQQAEETKTSEPVPEDTASQDEADAPVRAKLSISAGDGSLPDKPKKTETQNTEIALLPFNGGNLFSGRTATPTPAFRAKPAPEVKRAAPAAVAAAPATKSKPVQIARINPERFARPQVSKISPEQSDSKKAVVPSSAVTLKTTPRSNSVLTGKTSTGTTKTVRSEAVTATNSRSDQNRITSVGPTKSEKSSTSQDVQRLASLQPKTQSNNNSTVLLRAVPQVGNSDPKKSKFKRIVGKEVLPKKPKTKRLKKGSNDVRLAALDPKVTPNIKKPDVIDEDHKLVDDAGKQVKPLIKEKPREVQTQLARLGCYRSRVDGKWGRRSSLALLRYYKNKKIAPISLAPTEDVLVVLLQDNGKICKYVAPKIRKKKKKKPSSTIASRKSSKSKASKKRVSKKSRRKSGKRLSSASKAKRKRSLKGLKGGGVFR